MHLHQELLLTSLALCLCGPLPTAITPAAYAAEPLIAAGEFVTTPPIVADGVLYIASFSRPEHAGHLRAIDLVDTPDLLWDAAGRMPAPGTGASPGPATSSDPPQLIDADNLYRSLFTNLESMAGDRLQPVSPTESARLQTVLDAATYEEARALINRVRGRIGTTPGLVDGTADAEHLLWGISRSTPAVAGRSLLAEDAAGRAQVVYVGGEDGMLHAFHAGHWDDLLNRHDQGTLQAGRELWAYIPGSLLARLKHQPFEDGSGEFAVHVDGSPVIGDFFLDRSGDGRRQWRTLLVGTASIAALNRSIVFTLDVTDPCRPQVLWEHALAGTNPGLTRGAMTGSTADKKTPCLFLTTGYAQKIDPGGSPDPVNGTFGIQAFALDLLTGSLVWQWRAPYVGPAAEVNTTPAQPALLDANDDGAADWLVFGDMAGRLWAIDAASGSALGGVPVYTVADGAAQPIGAGVATDGRIAIFGTGGAEHADDSGSYAVYAVEILPTGGQLRWVYPLAPGEKVWDTPAVDRLGRIYFAASTGFQPAGSTGWPASGGRLVILDKTGQEQASAATDSAVLGTVQLSSNLAVAVSVTGEVYQFGSAQRTTRPDLEAAGPIRFFSWRLR